MIPGDLGAEIARVAAGHGRRGRAAAAAASLPAAGTWRPAPAEAGGGPGTYATSLPLALARLAGLARRARRRAAGGRAGRGAVDQQRPGDRRRLPDRDGDRGAPGRPARQDRRPGRAAAASGALAGTRLTAPRLPDPAAAPDWAQAWRAQRDALAGRLADAAGAEVLFFDSQREPTGEPPAQARAGARRSPRPAAAPAGAGLAAARSLPPWRSTAPTPSATPWPGRPHREPARSAASLASRWTWRTRSCWSGTPTPTRPRRCAGRPTSGWRRTGRRTARAGAEPACRPNSCSLDALSWLPERVAAAARRRRPAELAALPGEPGRRVAGLRGQTARRCRSAAVAHRRSGRGADGG